MHGIVGDAGSTGWRLIGRATLTCECFRLVTALHRSSPTADAIRSIAVSRRLMALDPLQVAKRRPRTTQVMGLRRLRLVRVTIP
jgi:hypothetical protein